jgi:hypothetical protein
MEGTDESVESRRAGETSSTDDGSPLLFLPVKRAAHGLSTDVVSRMDRAALGLSMDVVSRMESRNRTAVWNSLAACAETFFGR